MNGTRWVLTLTVLVAPLLIAAQPAQAQTETVLYNFTGGTDGLSPTANLIRDGAGNFYGTTLQGGYLPCSGVGCGVVFELSPNGGGWNENVLYSFGGGKDGANPFIAPVIFDKSGNLYGTTEFSGKHGFGVVYELRHSKKGWKDRTLYSFNFKNSFGHPASGLVMDAQANLYGTTSEYQATGGVFELAHSGTLWHEQAIYNAPTSCGLTMDGSGNLYGTTNSTVFELSPNGNGGWTATVLYTFTGAPEDGISPWMAPVIDAAGNLYGTTYSGGATNNGTVYELTPSKNAKGEVQWTEQILYSFAGGTDGAMPIGQPVLDGAGNIYGTTQKGGELDYGTVFELVPIGGGVYQEKILWSFHGTDGAGSMAGLILDGTGTLYGTTPGGGLYGAGVVFAVTP
ncbi:MAG: choice-of-anchor tandem repeat GloVer-containing protein [Terriglobales bacterium]